MGGFLELIHGTYPIAKVNLHILHNITPIANDQSGLVSMYETAYGQMSEDFKQKKMIVPQEKGKAWASKDIRNKAGYSANK